MPTTCAVATCRNYFQRTRDKGIRYFAFPKDPSLRKVWISKCRRKDSSKLIASAAICSCHFTPDDYEVNKVNEMLKIAYKKRLKKTAIPSLNLSTSNEIQQEKQDTSATIKQSLDTTAAAERAERHKRRTLKQEKKEILERALCRLQTLSPVKKFSEVGTNTPCQVPSYQTLSQETKKLNRELYQLRKKLIRSEDQYRTLIANKANSNQKKAKEIFYEKLKRVFTPGQITALWSEGKRVCWNQEDITAAMKLRSISVRAYKRLRASGLPLPGYSTLNKWVATDASNNNQSVCSEGNEDAVSVEYGNALNLNNGEIVIVEVGAAALDTQEAVVLDVTNAFSLDNQDAVISLQDGIAVSLKDQSVLENEINEIRNAEISQSLNTN